MALPDFTMRQLLEAGAHFGHQSHRWNPKMAPYIFGTRNNIHIIDLAQTVPLLHLALKAVSDTVARGGRVLFVGTKRQAQDAIADAAKRSAQYYINSRWLGGMLTNWKTVSASIQRLRKLDETLDGGGAGLTKKERLMISRERDKLLASLGGIKNMRKLPDALFIVDSNNEAIAVKEARKLGIPVVAVVDTNCDPTVVDHVIPGNDDALRAIRLFTSKISDSVIEGVQMAGDKQSAEIAGVTSDIQAGAEEGHPEFASDEQAGDTEVVDLEAALGGGIRKAPAIVAALEEAEAAESSL